MTTNRRLGLGLGVLLGAVALALVAAVAVLLPEATGDDEVSLPDSLPGGWKAVDAPGGADAPDASAMEEATAYVDDVYADVYDEPVAFRAYADSDVATFVVVTVFTSDGGAFGPPNGVADPEALELERATTELVRRGDVVCVANYQPVAAGEDAGEESEGPIGVSCQLPTDGHTIQLATNGLDLDETVQLVHDVEDAI